MQCGATSVTNAAIHPRVAVHGISSRDWTLEQDLDFYRAAGIHTLGIPSRKMPTDAAAADAAVARVRGSGLALSCYVAENPGGDYLSEEHAPASVARLLAGIDTAAALGAPC